MTSHFQYFLLNKTLQEAKQEIKRRAKILKFSEPTIKKMSDDVLKVFSESPNDIKGVKRFISKLYKKNLILKDVKEYMIKGIDNLNQLDNYDKLCLVFIMNELARGNMKLIVGERD